MNYNAHKAEVIHSMHSMTCEQIELAIEAEDNDAVRIWMWQYLQEVK